MILELIALTRDGHTGALHVGGTPGGIVYLVAGLISYAETPACPGFGDRLVRSGRVPAAVWQAAYDEGLPAGRVGLILVRDGHLGPGELARRLVVATAAALHEIVRGDGPAVFVPGQRDWCGASRNMTHNGCDPRSQRARRMAHCNARLG